MYLTILFYLASMFFLFKAAMLFQDTEEDRTIIKMRTQKAMQLASLSVFLAILPEVIRLFMS